MVDIAVALPVQAVGDAGGTDKTAARLAARLLLGSGSGGALARALHWWGDENAALCLWPCEVLRFTVSRKMRKIPIMTSAAILSMLWLSHGCLLPETSSQADAGPRSSDERAQLIGGKGAGIDKTHANAVDHEGGASDVGPGSGGAKQPADSKSGAAMGGHAAETSAAGNASGGTGGTATRSISGAVTGATTDGIVVSLSGAKTATTATDTSGKYTFTNLEDGEYKIVPSGSGYSFAPIEKTVLVAGANVQNADFASAVKVQTTYSIAGFVIGEMLDGVTVQLTGAANATATLESGRFVFFDLSDGTYTVTPSLPGSTFVPPSTSVTIKGATAEDQGFGMCSADKWCFQIINVTHSALNSIWANSAKDVWAVGEKGTIIRWNGSSWLEVPGAPSEELKWVWGTGPSDVWIVGLNNTVLRWDGTKLNNIPVEPQSYTSVWGSGPNDVWLSGSTNSFRWNGSSFTKVENYADGYTSYAQMWGSSTTDLWAVGPGILRWNGMSWTLVKNDAAANDEKSYYKSGIWASSSTSVWIVDQGGSIFHWNGIAWTRELNNGDVYKGFEGIWGSSANDIWAVGGRGTLVHWDGNSWKNASSGAATLTTDVSGTGANDVWATTGRNILHYSGK
ncbi:MAG TPA: SdrD B-like domain-containing protein [Polyangiales bacterium]|nr:SdrD B-like domain-containing protein [Polyangiales bacterium]